MHVEDYHGIDYIGSTVHRGTAQRSTAVQCCTLQCSRVQYCTMLLYTVPYLIACGGLFIVICSTGHVSIVQYSYELYSLIRVTFQVFLQEALEVFKSVAFHHIAAFSRFRSAICILFIAYSSLHKRSTKDHDSLQSYPEQDQLV